ncbi:serine hydrolase [Lactobacillaceae bacterium L1_55_11]|nr:serine hydrolase [Lactobacillaceae bacterium L1_55_11]
MKKPSKKNKRRWWLASVLIGLLVLVLAVLGYGYWHQHHPSTSQQPAAVKDQPVALSTDAKTGLVVDLSTGQVLGEKNADQSLPIASLSKLLTAYAVLRNIEQGKLKWDEQVTIPASADLSKQRQDLFSHLDIQAGDRVAVKDLYTAMFTNSANDAAFALADYITPKGQTTQQMLQYWAKTLKLQHSEWYNAAGQQNGDAMQNKVKSASDKAANRASARDIAVIARADLNLNPSLKGIGQMKTLTYTKNGNDKITVPTDFGQSGSDNQQQLDNPHHFVIEGLKTGSTPESGAAFAGLITDPDGHQFLTVINGAGDYEDRVQRYQKTFDMLDEVLNQKDSHQFTKGQVLDGVSTVQSNDTKDAKISVHVAMNRNFWTPKGADLNWETPASFHTTKPVQVNQLVTWVKPALDAQYLPATPVHHTELGLASDDHQALADWGTRILRWFGW